MKRFRNYSLTVLAAIALGFLTLKARSLVVLAPFSSQPFFTGFPVTQAPDGMAGPMACFWNQGLLYVSSQVDGYIYTVDIDGGKADAAHRLDGA